MAHPELEFFLLSIVHSGFRHLDLLERARLDEAVNRAVPVHTRAELIDTLSDLFRGGDLQASHECDIGAERWFIPTREEIDAALCGALKLWYCLTSQGGARWEAMSGFDWNYEIGSGLNFESQDVCIEATSRETIETYISWRSTFSSEDHVVPGSEKWSTLKPWQPNYWKTLPQGVRLEYVECTVPRSLGWPSLFEDLWSREWNDRRHARMRAFVPMASHRQEPDEDCKWRVEFQEVANAEVEALPALLNSLDTAVQYAAGLRLVALENPEQTSLLVEWFLQRPRRYSLRVLSRIRDARVLEALVFVFRTEPWDDPRRQAALGEQIGDAIAAFGDAAVPLLATLLESDDSNLRVLVLDCLGKTSSEAAGTLILNWLPAQMPDRYSRSWWEIQVALLALARLKDLRCLPVLAEVIQVEPDYVRESLILLDHPDGWSIVNRFLGSTHRIHDRRWAACLMARKNSEYQAECNRLCKQREVDELRKVACWLVSGGRLIDLPDPIAALIERLSSFDSPGKVAATTLICRHAEQFPEAAIAHLLEDPAPEVRANAAYAFGLRGGPIHMGKLQSLLNDEHGLVRYCAKQALSRLVGSVPSSASMGLTADLESPIRSEH